MSGLNKRLIDEDGSESGRMSNEGQQEIINTSSKWKLPDGGSSDTEEHDDQI